MADKVSKSTANKATTRSAKLRPGATLALIDTKLAPPQAPARLLSVPHLEEKFDAAFSRRLICLIASAGYGKTITLTKLRGFVESRGVRTGWVSLDREDNDPVRFLHYVIAALQRAMPGLGRYALAQMGHGALPTLEPILLALCNDLTRIEGGLALFLDDYHVIENEAVHSVINWLIERGPPNVRFFISTRMQLPLSLGKLRLADEIYEIQAEDLSLRLDEAGPFVSMVSGQELNASHIRMLHERTEGWIAGLQLASLALKGGSNVTEFVNAFSGSDRDITAYLGEIVLRQLPPKVGEFLTHTALFDRFSAEFCRDALAEADAVQLIEWVKVHNLFLMPLDRQHEWHRYHHLFADFIRGRFILSHPDEAKAFYRAGSAWFDRHGSIGEAIRYALAGHDYVHAADMVARHAYELVQLRGEHATLFAWLVALPPSYVEQRPQIKLAHIWSLMFTHRYREAEAEFSSIERSIETSGAVGMPPAAEATEVDVSRKARMMRCIFYALTDRTVLSGQRCVDWLSRWEHSDPFDVGSVLTTFGYSTYVAQDYEQARQSFVSARSAFEQCESYYGIAWAETLHALTALEQGDAFEAEHILARAHKVISEKVGPHSYAGSLLALLRAQVYYEQNRLEEAGQILEGAFQFASGHGVVETVLGAYVTKARILWLRGHPDEADTCLAEGASVAERLELRRLALMLGAERIHLYLRSGLIDRALRVARSFGLAGSDSTDTRHRREPSVDDASLRLVDIRLQLATDQTDRSHLLLGNLLTEARRHGRNMLVIKLLALKAALQVRRGNRDEARRLIDEALAIGASGGLCRVLADEGNLVAELVREIAERRMSLKGDDPAMPREYMMHVLNALERKSRPGQAGPTATAPAQVRREDFSERELQILRLVSSGLGNRDLAARLFLSEATVKWHLRNIFAKLGVSNRTGALARARELSLL